MVAATRSSVPYCAVDAPVPASPTPAASAAHDGSENGHVGSPLPPNVRIVRTTDQTLLAVARRLVSQSQRDSEAAAQRLVSNAADHGIDLRLSWFTAGEDNLVRQACLTVPGAGRTAVIYVSEPPRSGDAGGHESGVRERAALVSAACSALASEHAGRVRIVQALPDPGERWATGAYARVPMRHVGNLAYMRRPPRPTDKSLTPKASHGAGIEIVPGRSVDDDAVVRAMDASYEATLDCPELCGLRGTSEILASHKSVGVMDRSLWWVVTERGEPKGCAIFAPCPAQRGFELVYVGLAPGLRGRGIGRSLLNLGIASCAAISPAWSMTCAVDERNAPAIRMYESLGFRSFAKRVAFVKPVP